MCGSDRVSACTYSDVLQWVTFQCRGHDDAVMIVSWRGHDRVMTRSWSVMIVSWRGHDRVMIAAVTPSSPRLRIREWQELYRSCFRKFVRADDHSLVMTSVVDGQKLLEKAHNLHKGIIIRLR